MSLFDFLSRTDRRFALLILAHDWLILGSTCEFSRELLLNVRPLCIFGSSFDDEYCRTTASS
jgi:hypothetical protein